MFTWAKCLHQIKKIGGTGNSESTSYMDAKSNDPIMMCVYMHKVLITITAVGHMQISLISLKELHKPVR